MHHKKIFQALRLTFVAAWISSGTAMAAEVMSNMNHKQHQHELSKSVTQTPDGSMPEMRHHGSRQDAPKISTSTDSVESATLRDPHAYSDGYDFGAIPPPQMADTAYMGRLLVNRFEAMQSTNSTVQAYDLQGWFGKDYNQVALKAEGIISGGNIQDARTELLWQNAVAAYWNSQLGVRIDNGGGVQRNWLALGLQGLAPYWFGIDATAYVGDRGQVAARMSGEYELLITQKLILQPRLEATLYSQQDVARELGAGLSSMLAGLRLRYEIQRKFAPYIGVEWSGKFAQTANLARAAGAPVKQMSLVAGLRFWF